jgi:[acyl-carrier-protein] S-malonyltransferase
MASVLGGDLEVIKAVCKEIDIDVANYNCPGQVVISGEKSKVEAAVAELKGRGLRKVIMLNVAGAFHSRLMKSAGEGLAAVLDQADICVPAVPVYHNFTADKASSVEELKSNLVNQVAGSVRWEDCVRRAVADGADTVIEFGPGAVLTGLVRRTVSDLKLVNINSAASLEAAVLE